MGARVHPRSHLPPRSPVVPADARSTEASGREPALEACDRAQARYVCGAVVSPSRSDELRKSVDQVFALLSGRVIGINADLRLVIGRWTRPGIAAVRSLRGSPPQVF